MQPPDELPDVLLRHLARALRDPLVVGVQDPTAPDLRRTVPGPKKGFGLDARRRPEPVAGTQQRVVRGPQDLEELGFSRPVHPGHHGERGHVRPDEGGDQPVTAFDADSDRVVH